MADYSPNHSEDQDDALPEDTFLVLHIYAEPCADKDSEPHTHLNAELQVSDQDTLRYLQMAHEVIDRALALAAVSAGTLEPGSQN